jgi:hypothetical protein
MPLHGVNNLGQHRDMTQRHPLTYVDEVSRNNGVASAGEITYDRNYAVDSKAVVNPLQFDSLVLTAVRDPGPFLLDWSSDTMIFRFRTRKLTDLVIDRQQLIMTESRLRQSWSLIADVATSIQDQRIAISNYPQQLVTSAIYTILAVNLHGNLTSWYFRTIPELLFPYLYGFEKVQSCDGG